MSDDPKRTVRRLYFALSQMELGLASGSDNVSYRDVLYLDLIVSTPDCTVSKIADMLRVSRPAVTTRVNSLVEQGLVVKTKSPDDERVNILTVSDSTNEVYAEEGRVIDRAMSRLVRRYPPESMDMFCEMLDSLCDDLIADPDPDGPSLPIE